MEALIRDEAIQGDSRSEQSKVAHLLPRSPNGAIIITTRNKRLAVDLAGSFVEVPRMNEIEAKDLIESKLGYLHNQEELHSLVAGMEYLPLALVQAAAYLQKTSITIRKYLELYKRNNSIQIRLLESHTDDLERDHEAENAVLKTLALSFDQTKLEHPRANDILAIVSFLDPQGIPESILETLLPDTLELTEALATLRAFALITPSADGDSFDLHRIVQLAMRRQLEASAEPFAWSDKATEMLVLAWDNLPESAYMKKCGAYFTNTVAALSAKSGPTHDSQLIRARLIEHAGSFLSLEGHSTASYQKYSEAMDVYSRLLGDEHPKTLTTMMHMGYCLILMAQGDVPRWKRGEELLLKASTGLEAALGPNDPKAMEVKNQLIDLYIRSGQREIAKEMLETMLRPGWVACDSEAKRFKITMEAKRALAKIYCLEGDHRKAEELQLAIISIYEQHAGRQSMTTQLALDDLAETYISMGEFDRGVVLRHELLENVRTTFGHSHPVTLQEMQSLASMLHRGSRHQEALIILEDLSSLMQPVYDSHNLRYLDMLNTKAEVFKELKLFDDAVKLCEFVLSMRRERQDFEHIETKRAMRTAEDCYSRLGRYEDAMKLLVNIIELDGKVLGDKDPRTFYDIVQLALNYFMLTEPDVAMKLGKEKWTIINAGTKDPTASMDDLAKIISCSVENQETENPKTDISDTLRNTPLLLSTRQFLRKVLSSRNRSNRP